MFHMPPTSPSTSYVVWHTQRTGSTLLCTTLEATGVAGHPDEWPEDGLKATTESAATIRDTLWSKQSTPNDVLGVKWSYHQPTLDDFYRVFGRDRSGERSEWRQVWESVFPNCHHIVMTRRNKIRLAVSWWKSISGGQGHLSQDGSPLPWQNMVPTAPADLAGAYDFKAIKALVFEAARREAGLQELLAELQVSPLSVTYEDFVANYEQTVQGVLDHLGLHDSVSETPPPLLARTSDYVNEEWVRRFLADLNSEAG